MPLHPTRLQVRSWQLLLPYQLNIYHELNIYRGNWSRPDHYYNAWHAGNVYGEKSCCG
jgi:hypothetical protein